MSYIELQNVEKKYVTGEICVYAADKISFEVEKGEFVVVVSAERRGQNNRTEHFGRNGQRGFRADLR